MVNVTLPIGMSVPKDLESLMKVKKVTKITDIVRKENSYDIYNHRNIQSCLHRPVSVNYSRDLLDYK
jgi:hypothetical protein